MDDAGIADTLKGLAELPGSQAGQADLAQLPNSKAKQLTEAKHDRAKFDPLLEQFGRQHSTADLTQIAGHFLGYKPTARTKADLVAAMHRRQRQDELNADRVRAQAKFKV